MFGSGAVQNSACRLLAITVTFSALTYCAARSVSVCSLSSSTTKVSLLASVGCRFPLNES